MNRTLAPPGIAGGKNNPVTDMTSNSAGRAPDIGIFPDHDAGDLTAIDIGGRAACGSSA